jgi:hypothetical protein
MRKRFGVVLVLVIGVVAAPRAHAAEPPIDLRWSAPPDCPDRAAFVNTIAEQRGYMPPLQPDAPTLFDGRLERTAQGFTLYVRTRADGVPGQRSLTGDDCTTLARVAAMIASVLMDQGVAQEPEAAIEAPPSPPLVLRAQAVVDAGSLPALALGPSLTVGMRLHATSLELGASYLPTQSINVAAAPVQPAAELQLLAGSLGACQALLPSPELGPCARVEYGRMSGRALELANAGSGSAHWLFAWLGAHIGVELARSLWLAGDLEAGVRVLRAEFTIGSLGSLHEVPWFVGRARLGFEWRPW